MHRPTKVVLAVVAGVFLWANAAESPLWRELDVGPTGYHGDLGDYLFMRGWPLSPWMFCPYRSMRNWPEEHFGWEALVVDAGIAFVVLLAIAFLMEREIRKSEIQGGNGAFRFTLARLLVVIGLLSLPLTLAYYLVHDPKWLPDIVRVFAVDVGRSCLFAFSVFAVCLAICCYVADKAARVRSRR